MNREGERRVDVLVVGAGPTGLTLACELRRRGLDCRLFDKAAQPHRRSRGKGLQPRSLEVFDDLGVAEEALEAGRRGNHLRLFVGGRLTADVDLPARPPRPGVPYPDLLVIPQWCTEQILRHRLRSLGGTVEWRREVLAVEQDAHGVTATASGPGSGAPERVRARFLVGCDGGHSTVRELAGLRLSGDTKTQHFVLGDVRIDGLEPGISYAWFDGKDYLAADPLSGTGTWQVQASMHPDVAGRLEPASLELFQRLFADRGLPGVRLHDPTWLSNFSPRAALVDRYRVGRVLVAGDAAHVHSPAGGQGMNTGIQDAYNLGWKLALVLQQKASDRLLDTYQDERLPVARSVLEGSDVGHSVVFSPNPVMRVVREKVLAPLLQLRAVQRAILDRSAELDVGYRNGRSAHDGVTPGWRATVRSGPGAPAVGLADRLRFRRGPHAGDRAPDARGQGTDGRPVRLFDRFRGPHATLLLFTGTSARPTGHETLEAIAGRVGNLLGGDVRPCFVVPASRSSDGLDPDSVVLDPDGQAHRLYGARAQSLYLVRPDGYVGYRSLPADEAGLVGYLDTVFDGEAASRRDRPRPMS